MTTLPADLTNPCYHDDDAARVMFESIRWPGGPFCPICGAFDHVAPLGGKSMGPGWFWCSKCRDKFTVRVGTVLERSHIALHKWLIGFRLYASSKKGFSAHQLMRTLGLGSYRSAWFMAHRIREAMKETNPAPLGGEGKIVEADETFYGRKEDAQPQEGKWVFTNELGWHKSDAGVTWAKTKIPVVTLVERGGKARSVKVEDITARSLRSVVLSGADKKSALMTDELGTYRRIGQRFASHDTVTHSAEEYVRKLEDGTKAHTNTVEGYFSIFKRGMVGVYQHCNERHLPRYLAEFDFRYSNRVALGVDDAERSTRAIKGIQGKRLTYRRTYSQEGEA
jgi:transposase-like protein